MSFFESTEYTPKDQMSEESLLKPKTVVIQHTLHKNSFLTILINKILIGNQNYPLWYTSSDVVDIGIIKVNQAFKLNRFVKHITLAPRGYKPRGFWLISWDFSLHLKCYKRKPHFFLVLHFTC